MGEYKLTDFVHEDRFELHSYLTYLFEQLYAGVHKQEHKTIKKEAN